MKEINNQIGPNIEQLWNVAMQVLHNILGFVLNTTAYHMGRYSCRLLLLKRSMVQLYILQVNIILLQILLLLQVSDKERTAQQESLFKDVATHISEMCVNPDSRRPHPGNRSRFNLSK